MSKSLEDLIDEDYERLDQEVYEMEELGLSNYGDRSYYIRNRDEYEKDKTIADLEAKLAESEKNLALCEELRDVEETEYSEDISKTNSALFRKCQQVSRLIEENEQLKQQLAEKDKEIKDLKIDLEAKDFNINTLMEQRKRKQKFYNQDKISFAVEKLEKVKAELVNNVSPVNLSYTEYVQEVFNKLNNQIKQLKEMK